MFVRTGLDVLLLDEGRLAQLRGRRVALLGHPASMTGVELGFRHALDALAEKLGRSLTAAFGPQHGMRGDKQYNMDESASYTDPVLGIPVFSLYGEVRRPTAEMLATFDLLLFDLQDTGWRGYTWVATLLYLLQACARRARRSGCWIVPTRPDARSRDRPSCPVRRASSAWSRFPSATV